MDRQKLNNKIGEIIENDRKDKERGEEIFIGDIVDDILMNVDLYIEENFERKK